MGACPFCCLSRPRSPQTIDKGNKFSLPLTKEDTHCLRPDSGPVPAWPSALRDRGEVFDEGRAADTIERDAQPPGPPLHANSFLELVSATEPRPQPGPPRVCPEPQSRVAGTCLRGQPHAPNFCVPLLPAPLLTRPPVSLFIHQATLRAPPSPEAAHQPSWGPLSGPHQQTGREAPRLMSLPQESVQR